MEERDIDNLKFIYERMKNVYQESEYEGYMIRFQDAIDRIEDFMDKVNEQKEVLKLAGRLSSAARLVTESQVNVLSGNIEYLKSTMEIYDDKIISLTNKSK